MCGIFGIISPNIADMGKIRQLARSAQQRGKDSSGLMFYANDRYKVNRADYDINILLNKKPSLASSVILGHSRLITSGQPDNQPIVRDGIVVFHNGIIVNVDTIWGNLAVRRKYQIDTEAILGLAITHLEQGRDITHLPRYVLDKCRGTVSAALAIPKLGKLLLFSNNGSLYIGKSGSNVCFASEHYSLKKLKCTEINQVRHRSVVLDIPPSDNIEINDDSGRTGNLIPTFKNVASEEALLLYPKYNLRRCTKCILPETMPFIRFDEKGKCNYCENYKTRNNPKSKDELLKLVEPYRRNNERDCIVPFSGGRDSCWGLHLIVNELGMKPITYTYDWGMVTDVGRRNISRMCSELNVENIIVADNIVKKRRNIAMNLKAWLKAPNLGMVSILTAGDKHFFRHVETVKNQTGIGLNLWAVNPLEVTYFKAGFLGIPPDFEETKVYMNGWSKQLNYQLRRFKAMLQSPGYFNRSLWDTVSGEFYRSLTKKSDYFHIFDYWRWDEEVCNETLKQYDWELASDTATTWRIGDGTAAFYNYVFYTAAGFTEHDTFRSNQIREGQLTRERALSLVELENTPRYQNIKWYLDTLNLDFRDVIEVINTKSLIV